MDEFQAFIKDLSVQAGFYNGIHVKDEAYRLIRASQWFLKYAFYLIVLSLRLIRLNFNKHENLKLRTYAGGLRVEGVMMDAIDQHFIKLLL